MEQQYIDNNADEISTIAEDMRESEDGSGEDRRNK